MIILSCLFTSSFFSLSKLIGIITSLLLLSNKNQDLVENILLSSITILI